MGFVFDKILLVYSFPSLTSRTIVSSVRTCELKIKDLRDPRHTFSRNILPGRVWIAVPESSGHLVPWIIEYSCGFYKWHFVCTKNFTEVKVQITSHDSRFSSSNYKLRATNWQWTRFLFGNTFAFTIATHFFFWVSDNFYFCENEFT